LSNERLLFASLPNLERSLYQTSQAKAISGIVAKVGKWHRTCADLLLPVGKTEGNMAQTVVIVVETRVAAED
jgi:hypothetical protein